MKTHNVTVSAFGNETTIGGGIYSTGEYSKVTATANAGETFVGWYTDNTLVSTDAEYRFLVDRNVSITAKFTQNTSAPDIPVTPTPTPTYPTNGNTGGIPH